VFVVRFRVIGVFPSFLTYIVFKVDEPGSSRLQFQEESGIVHALFW
jgi:hypothetical protein